METERLPCWGRPVTRMMSAFALDVNVVSGLHGRELLQRIRTAGLVPHIPHGAVFLAEAPEREGLQAKGAGGAQFIEHGDAIEEPDDVALVRVFVHVLKMRIEGVVVEIEIGVRIRGALPGFRDGEVGLFQAPGFEKVLPHGL